MRFLDGARHVGLEIGCGMDSLSRVTNPTMVRSYLTTIKTEVTKISERLAARGRHGSTVLILLSAQAAPKLKRY